MNRVKFIQPSEETEFVSLYRSSDIYKDYTRIVYHSAFDSSGNPITELIDPDGKASDWYIIGFIDSNGNESYSEPTRAGRESLLDSVRKVSGLTRSEINDSALNTIILNNTNSIISRITSVAYDEELELDTTINFWTTDKQPILDRHLDGYFSSQDVILYYREHEDEERIPIDFISGSSQGYFQLSGSYAASDIITGDWLYFKNPDRLDYNLIREAIILGSIADAYTQMISGLSKSSSFKFGEKIKVGKVSKTSGASSKDIWRMIESYLKRKEEICNSLLMSSFRRFRLPSTKRREFLIQTTT